MNNVKKEYERMFGELSSDDRGSIPVCKVTSSGNICVDGKEYFVINGPYDKIVRELRDTYIAKNADYGNSFEKSIDEFGVISAIVRMSDKMERLKSLTVNNALDEKPMVDESILDTTKDLANYAIMLAMYLEKEVGTVRFRKKPVIIEAVKFLGEGCFSDKPEWLDIALREEKVRRFLEPNTLIVETLEGPIFATIGDYIIQGVKGELYPCKPDIFEMTYEEV